MSVLYNHAARLLGEQRSVFYSSLSLSYETKGPDGAVAFGFDATAGVVHDWMYESLAQEYVLDETNREFMTKSNPWALRGIVEKLHEAKDRGLWESPDPETLAAMQQVYLELEGDLEDRG